MPIVDIHACIGVQPEDDRAHDSLTLLAEMDRAGVAEALCVHFTAIRYDAALGNARLQEICRCQPRLHPVAVVNPSIHSGVLEQVRRSAEGGACAFRFTPARQGWSVDSQAFIRAWGAMAETGLPGLVEVGGSGEATRLAHNTSAYPATLILANVSYGTLGEAVAVLQRYEHTVLEACRLVTPGVVEYLVDTVGAGRLLFGSGAPAWDIIPTLAMIQQADISAQDRGAILEDNARRIFGLEGRAVS
jgi:predicted TIM-barrel fold metal-dependent hydrolase